MLQMDDVEWMLSDAAESLKGYIISLMEGMALEEAAIQSACDSHPVFEPVWMAALNSISSAIYLTAYCRYLDWRNHKYDKHKTTHVNVQSSDSSTQLTSTSFSMIPMTSSSGATTSSSDAMTSSSDVMVSSSAGLSLDVQPEHSAKKSKIQPEGNCEGSKAKPKKKAKPKTDKANGNGKGKSRS